MHLKGQQEHVQDQALELPTVPISLWYLERLPVYKSEKPFYVNFPVPSESGVSQHNLLHTRVDNLQIRDIRGHEDQFHIDIQGFQLVRHHTALTNDEFEDDRLVRSKYYPEIVQLVKATLGAADVFPFEHTHRLNRVDTRGCDCDRKRKPLKAAHIDQTPESSAQRVHYHMGDRALSILKRRFQVVNVWRPLFGPLRDFPLTLGDGRTFNLSRDGEPTDLVFPHYIGESMNLYHHTEHQWYFVSDQMRDEVWMFKCFDSQEGSITAAPHCSFDIQAGSQNERLRESVEIRLLVFYDS